MGDSGRSIAVLDALSNVGVGLSIDDFGTGYSSLSYLKRLPIEEIKIDRSFVMQMHVDANDFMIVRATVDLGRNLGLRVVAEGVEDLATFDRLADFGCDEAQGYYISRPVSAVEFTRWMSVRNLDREVTERARGPSCPAQHAARDLSRYPPATLPFDAPVDRDGGFRCCPRGSDVARGSRAGVDRVGAVRAAPDLARPADRGAGGDGRCLRAGGARDRAGAADPRRRARVPTRPRRSWRMSRRSCPAPRRCCPRGRPCRTSCISPTPEIAARRAAAIRRSHPRARPARRRRAGARRPCRRSRRRPASAEPIRVAAGRGGGSATRWRNGWSSSATGGSTWSSTGASSRSAAACSTCSRPSSAGPMRLEFWGDEIESIRRFVPSTQLSAGAVDVAEIGPARELILDDALRARARDAATELGDERVADLLGRIADGLAPDGLESAAPFLFDELPAPAAAFPDGAWVVLTEARRTRSRARAAYDDAEALAEALAVARPARRAPARGRARRSDPAAPVGVHRGRRPRSSDRGAPPRPARRSSPSSSGDCTRSGTGSWSRRTGTARSRARARCSATSSRSWRSRRSHRASCSARARSRCSPRRTSSGRGGSRARRPGSPRGAATAWPTS